MTARVLVHLVYGPGGPTPYTATAHSIPPSGAVAGPPHVASAATAPAAVTAAVMAAMPPPIATVVRPLAPLRAFPRSGGGFVVDADGAVVLEAASVVSGPIVRVEIDEMDSIEAFSCLSVPPVIPVYSSVLGTDKTITHMRFDASPAVLTGTTLVRTALGRRAGDPTPLPATVFDTLLATCGPTIGIPSGVLTILGGLTVPITMMRELMDLPGACALFDAVCIDLGWSITTPTTPAVFMFMVNAPGNPAMDTTLAIVGRGIGYCVGVWAAANPAACACGVALQGGLLLSEVDIVMYWLAFGYPVQPGMDLGWVAGGRTLPAPPLVVRRVDDATLQVAGVVAILS